MKKNIFIQVSQSAKQQYLCLKENVIQTHKEKIKYFFYLNIIFVFKTSKY